MEENAFPRAKRGLRVLTLLRKEKVARMRCSSISRQAGFAVFMRWFISQAASRLYGFSCFTFPSSVARSYGFNLISPTKKDRRNPQSFRQSFFCFLFCYFGFSLSIFLFFFPFPTFLFPSSTPSPRRWRRSGRIRQQGSLPFPSSYGFRLPL